MRAPIRTGPVAAALVCALVLPETPWLRGTAAQPPEGRRIQAVDGDVIVVEDGDNIRIVRRRRGEVRAIYNPQQNWLVLLADYAPRAGAERDGGVDVTYSFHNLSGIWPLGERWQGLAVVDETSDGLGPSRRGLRLETANGVMHLLPSNPREMPLGEDGVTILYQGMGTGGSAGEPFDVAEPRKVAEALRNAEARASLPDGGLVTHSSISIQGGVAGGVGGVVGGMTSGRAALPAGPPYRPGGNISPPRLLTRAEPVLPAIARQAGVQGTVLLEVIIDEHGDVVEAKVLRSLPLLDDAALEAVRQWRYEPGQLHGRPVPVVMTVAVPFRL